MMGLIRPLGLLRGPAAEAALDEGAALRLAGNLACTRLEVQERDDSGDIRTSTPTVRSFFAQLERLGEHERAMWRTRLDHLRSGPAWPEDLPEPPLLMGIVNVTPDSFHDGGRYDDPGRAVEHGRQLVAEGAAIIDVGGESTRPGAAEVPVDEEIQRIVPVIRGLAREGIYTSIDTRKAEVMEAAIAAGARMVNDVTALRHDPAAAPMLHRCKVPVVLMHMQGEPATMQLAPTYRRASFEVAEFLEARALELEAVGIERNRLLLDPGIGFGKSVQHNLDILRHLDLYGCLGRPVVLGVSRKSFIGRLSAGEPAAARLPGSLAVNLWGVKQGAQILRVHDVAETHQALQIWRSLDA
ncbi:MAG: dihydropteroate synthase [Geminicoccaceae bacterium]|nr:dihydropteroate synthase [Geminicoccaceae bacterium]